MSAIIVDDEGNLVSPPLHDGQLIGFILQTKNSGKLLFDVDGKRIVLQIFGIIAIKIDGFEATNIVLGIEVFRGASVLLQQVEELCGMAESEGRVKYIKRLMKKIVDEQSLLLDLSPSLGASLSILCAGIDWDVESPEGDYKNVRPIR